MAYQIESKGPDGNWLAEYVGDPDGNTFETAAEAAAYIPELRKLGDGWAEAEYRVVEISA